MSRVLDTMVTVVDAVNLLRDYSSTDFLADRGESLGADDKRTMVDLLVEQIEFADVVVLNKIDDASPDQLRGRPQDHPRAQSRRAISSRPVSPMRRFDRILNTGRFDFEKAQQHPLWFKELYDFADHTPETEQYGVSSFVYRARRPFDPGKFHRIPEGDMGRRHQGERPFLDRHASAMAR